MKAFTGQVFCPNHNYGWHSIQHDVFEVARIPRETILCISNSRVLEPIEWRFWIVNGEVAAYASYSWNDAIESGVLPPVPDAALIIAEQMAGNPWQPDVTFVVDVVQDAMDGQFYLNELNATSTSGVYNVSAPSLLNALKNVAEKELDGDVSIIDD